MLRCSCCLGCIVGLSVALVVSLVDSLDGVSELPELCPLEWFSEVVTDNVVGWAVLYGYLAVSLSVRNEEILNVYVSRTFCT